MVLLYSLESFHLRVVDIVDVVLFAIILYQVYNLIKGTAAIRIFIGIIAVYLLWKVVKALQMELLSEILGQFISVGVIALIVVFQPEIRQFLLMVGKARIIPARNYNRRILFWKVRIGNPVNLHIDKIVKACKKMADTRTGALIVLTRDNELSSITETGQMINAQISEMLLETIFFKNGPLHDGAVVIVGQTIRAARCILPVSNKPGIPAMYGLRHRAAIGATERSDAIAIVVSEERGEISYSIDGQLVAESSPAELSNFLEKTFGGSVSEG